MNEQNKSLSDLDLIDCKTKNTLGKIYRPKGVNSGGRRRILAPDGCNASYHIMSRVVGGEFLLGAEEKEGLRKLMWKMSNFLGMKIGTYCIMDNHFHILVRVQGKDRFLRKFLPQSGEVFPVPERVEIDKNVYKRVVELAAWEHRLIKHLQTFYSSSYTAKLTHEIQQMRMQGREEEISDLLDRYRERFCSVQHFVKEIKERFTRWYNKKHGRKGTLWMDRYKSVLVEDGVALQTMSAYIDLNPVRAGICDDPAEYGWSGYAEAESGSKRAKSGLCGILNVAMDSWSKNGHLYRNYLFDKGTEVLDNNGKIVKRGVNKEKLEGEPLAIELLSLLYSAKSKKGKGKKGKGEVVSDDGKFPQKLHRRLKGMTYGLIYGSKNFIANNTRYL